MDLVLTDDEVIAAAIEARLAWPVPFPTVATDVAHLAAAASRGRRSLAVRELTTSSSDGVAISPDIVGVLERAVSSRCVMAWVASIDDPQRLAGSSTALFRHPNGDLIDLITASGIHDIRTSVPDASEALILALAKNVFDFGFAGPEDSSARLLVGEFGGDTLIAVSLGRIESGAWGSDGIKLKDASPEWIPSRVAEVLR